MRNEQTTNDERRTTNDERQTTNDERQTTNDDGRSGIGNAKKVLFLQILILSMTTNEAVGLSIKKNEISSTVYILTAVSAVLHLIYIIKINIINVKIKKDL